MPLQTYNQFWQSLDEGADTRCSECELPEGVWTAIEGVWTARRSVDCQKECGVPEGVWQPVQAKAVGAGITQWLQLPAEKPSAILTRVRVPGRAARDFYARVNFHCRLSYGVRKVPVRNRQHQHLRAR